MSSESDLLKLRKLFGDRLQVNVPLKRYTPARVGGSADYFIIVNSAEELAEVATQLWESVLHFTILGNGSNVLVSDAGVRELVVLNRSKKIRFNLQRENPSVWVESGANLGNLARRAAGYGLSGLEWAAGIPGTVGGAVYGNAGAHGGDIAGNLMVANILQLNPTTSEGKPEILQEVWTAERFGYAYRSSILKRQPGRVVVLSAELSLEKSTPETVQEKMEMYTSARQGSQPAGASLGSIFKNPVNDHAGRLIEAAGLKGTTIGKVEISRKHANFFINQDGASASDYAELIKLAKQRVIEKFGEDLELEIELIGDWSGD